jgi:hypothetical protein
VAAVNARLPWALGVLILAGLALLVVIVAQIISDIRYGRRERRRL